VNELKLNYYIYVKISKASWTTSKLISRSLHITCSARAAEISSILEERILGAPPKVCSIKDKKLKYKIIY